MKPILISFSLSVVICLLLIEANAAGNGCAWSGCTWSGDVCSTGATGGSGRPLLHDSKRCSRWFKYPKKDFCCDSDCTYQQCGKTCESLNMKSYSEKGANWCSITIPGYGTFQGLSYFCCP